MYIWNVCVTLEACFVFVFLMMQRLIVWAQKELVGVQWELQLGKELSISHWIILAGSRL